MKGVLLFGKTYNARDAIKKSGGLWNPDHKGWIVSEDKKFELVEIVTKYQGIKQRKIEYEVNPQSRNVFNIRWLGDEKF